MVVLNNCESERSYILAELFNTCLKESCFSNCWKLLWAVHVFKNVGQRPTPKRPTAFLGVGLVNNKLVDHPEKCGLFLISNMILSLLNQLQVVSDRIARSFNRPGATRAVALDIPKAFKRV